MRRSVILASLALPLLAGLVLALVVTTAGSAPVDDEQSRARESVAPATSTPARASPGATTLSGARSANMSVAPSSTPVPPAPRRVERSHGAHSARAAMLAAKLQHLPKVPKAPAPVTRLAREHLPPEEIAAMEARGMDWRKLEQMIREGVPRGAAPAVDEPAAQAQGSVEEE